MMMESLRLRFVCGDGNARGAEAAFFYLGATLEALSPPSHLPSKQTDARTYYSLPLPP